ncbi:hypothetical protein EVAR_68184_1 [Eumeta japonica]|uniref:Uncharacterized protein n=1 Tax=Eumeta variegata TaxID=151549 RepID=A0A4C2A2B1_EUMVA|nr:hypothetical protein EVAR_68184_1 [Eumeta japonica]
MLHFEVRITTNTTSEKKGCIRHSLYLKYDLHDRCVGGGAAGWLGTLRVRMRAVVTLVTLVYDSTKRRTSSGTKGLKQEGSSPSAVAARPLPAQRLAPAVRILERVNRQQC